ncbi:hypothetical protein JCM10213_002460 [Rhodosporidiobolus nylandii]
MDTAPIPTLALAGGACFRCFASPSSPVPSPSTAPVHLKSCSSCRRVKYCSPACQTADWKDHKSFCRALAGCEHVQLGNQIDRFHLQQHLARAAAEAGSSSRPPPLQSAFIPPRILSTPTALPSSWAAYLSALPSPVFPPSTTTGEIYGSHLPPLSTALTVLASLRRLYPSGETDRATHLTLLLLDSTPETSKLAAVALEELFHQLPALKTIRTVTVAPQDAHVVPPGPDGTPSKRKVVHLPLCKACGPQGQGRTRTLEHCRWLRDFSPSPPSPTALALAIATDSSLPMCTPPTGNSAEQYYDKLLSSAATPDDMFWLSGVCQPLVDFARTGKFGATGIGFVVTAQTAQDALDAKQTAATMCSCYALESAAQADEQTPPKKWAGVSLELAWDGERNVWRDTRPKVDGWWDHRLDAMRPKCAHRDGDDCCEREEDLGVSWASGWGSAFYIGPFEEEGKVSMSSSRQVGKK